MEYLRTRASHPGRRSGRRRGGYFNLPGDRGGAAGGEAAQHCGRLGARRGEGLRVVGAHARRVAVDEGVAQALQRAEQRVEEVEQEGGRARRHHLLRSVHNLREVDRQEDERQHDESRVELALGAAPRHRRRLRARRPLDLRGVAPHPPHVPPHAHEDL